MVYELKQYIKSNNIKDNIISLSILLMPFALCMSIFISETLVLLINISFLIILFQEKNIIKDIKVIKYQILLPILLFILILLSLFFSEFVYKSFPASFFYFRYIILALAIYYIFNKKKILIKYLLTSFIILSVLIFFDSIYELLQINNLFGFKLEDYRISNNQSYFLTSFFDDEKKLGSFLIRLLPLIISVLFFLNYDKKYQFIFIIFFGCLIFLSSERVALFLFIIFFIFYIRIIPNKIFFLISTFILIFCLTFFNQTVTKKYILATLFQLGISKSTMNADWSELKYVEFNNINYFSEEHEKLIKSGIEIFKKKPLIGSGIKTFYDTCIKINKVESKNLVCSTHPHNTYIQLLSDTGIFSALLVGFIFIYIFCKNLTIFFKKNITHHLASFYILNIGILLNLMPLIPSGSIYNNWINLMIYFPMGFWLFLYSKIKNQSDKN